MHQMHVESQLNHWNRMAEILGFVGGVKWRLRQLQEYIAATPADERCPCRRGFVVNAPTDHWDGCEVGMREARLEELRAEASEERRRAREDEERRQEHAMHFAHQLGANCDAETLQWLPLSTLTKISLDCAKEFSRRYLTLSTFFFFPTECSCKSEKCAGDVCIIL